MERQNISSGAPWESIVGYSRAVKVGAMVFVSGTVATENGQVVGVGDAYAQTRCILQKITDTLSQAGGSLTDVVRSRIYVCNMAQWPEIARAHAEFFGQIRPASSMVEVKALIAPEYLVEIEVDAVLSHNQSLNHAQ
jgi:enamine deaminase RidA (YjgF/YER057c/UK114 family)